MEASRCVHRPLGDVAFDQLVRMHRASLERYVRGLGASREDAEEVVATALLRAYQNPPDAHLEREWRAWLSTVARNLWIDERRRRQVRLVAGDGALEAVPAPPVDHVAATAEEARQICAAIALLPPTQRAAVYLREVRGLSYEEIADELAMTLNGRDRHSASRPRQCQAPSRWDRRGLLRSRALATGTPAPRGRSRARRRCVRHRGQGRLARRAGCGHRRRGSGCAAWPGGRRHSRAQSRHPLVTVAERHRRGEACRVRDSWACHHPPAPARKGGVVPTRRPHAELDGAAFGRLPSGGRGDGRGRSRGCRDRRACRFEHGFSSRQAHARRAGAACSEGAPAAHTERIGAALPKAARPRATRGRRSAWELRYPA